MERYIEKDGKRLRLGYTTGSCAAAASKAAAWMLLTGHRRETISLTTPGGETLELRLQDICQTQERVSCAVEKDGGDDPDVTKGALIYGAVEKSREPGIHIDGGVGVGRVTKPGLDQPVGAAAINSVPRQMIRKALEEVAQAADYQGGLSVVISVPEGEQIAQKTFNPRLGIQGGISILGTTGIVEPMSEKALVDTIWVELRQRRASGVETALLTPGNYGAQFLEETLHIPMGQAVQASNFLGDALDGCVKLGFPRVLLVGHIGKLVKVAGNMLNTHSKYGDCRMEILASHGAAVGLAPELVEEILDAAACDEALAVLDRAGLREMVMERLMKKIGENLRHRAGEEMTVGVICFSKTLGVLGMTPEAEELLERVRQEQR